MWDSLSGGVCAIAVVRRGLRRHEGAVACKFSEKVFVALNS